MKPWTLTAIRYAESVLAENLILSGGDPDRKWPISFVFFYIRQGGKHILVDPGCDTMPGFEMKNYVLPLDALVQQGIQPERITDVIVTHGHHDHMDAIRHFPHSVLHMQAQAYESGKRYVPAGMQVELYEEGKDITPEIHIQTIGGHAKGSSVVILDDAPEKTVICGDECYSMQNLLKRIPTGSSCCPERSRYFVETFSGPQYRPLLCHDPSLQTGIVKTRQEERE